MIQPGSRVVVRTDLAIYQTAELITINKRSITIRFCKNTEWDSDKARAVPNLITETIDRKKVYYLGERY